MKRARINRSYATTRAVDIDCPIPLTYVTVMFMNMPMRKKQGCGAKAGHYCNSEGVGVDLCPERITAARRATRATRGG